LTTSLAVRTCRFIMVDLYKNVCRQFIMAS
jgi:hypothetical protein